MAANDIEVQRKPDAPMAAPAGSRMHQSMAAGEVEPSLGELFKELAEESSLLIRQEVALAKTEIRESASKAATDAISLAIWGAIAAVGGLVLVAFLVIGLGALIGSYWLSALIVGAVFLIVGGLAAMGYAKKLKSIDFAPDTTLETLKRDKSWAQSEARDVKRDLTA